jgi:hypothetical protein
MRTTRIGVAQYRQLVKEAARQFRCKPTSELARHVATLRLARSTFAERLVAGRDIDPAALLRIDEALRQYMPTGEPAGVRFTIQVAKLCAKCRAELEVEPPPVAEERPSPPPSKPPTSLNVVPLKQPQRSNNGAP